MPAMVPALTYYASEKIDDKETSRRRSRVRACTLRPEMRPSVSASFPGICSFLTTTTMSTPHVAISHSAPLVPVVVLRTDGALVLQPVRSPTEENMPRKAGLKTASGGFGRQACPGLWPGWYLYARPPPASTAPWCGPGDVAGPAVFVALDADPAAPDTILTPTEETMVSAVEQMIQGLPPPRVEPTPAVAAAAAYDGDDEAAAALLVVPDNKKKRKRENKKNRAAAAAAAASAAVAPEAAAAMEEVAPVVPVDATTTTKKRGRRARAAKNENENKKSGGGGGAHKKITRKELQAIGAAAMRGEDITVRGIVFKNPPRPPRAGGAPRKPKLVPEPAPVMKREEFDALQVEAYSD